VASEALTDYNAALSSIGDQFDAHKCKPIDSSQNALRIVREATDGK
jgi:inhibitor of KinA sporulation pathway (predicted exonuclease)